MEYLRYKENVEGIILVGCSMLRATELDLLSAPLCRHSMGRSMAQRYGTSSAEYDLAFAVGLDQISRELMDPNQVFTSYWTDSRLRARVGWENLQVSR